MSFMLTFVIAIRYFVFRFWTLLLNTVSQAFEKEEDKTIANPALLTHLLTLLKNKWKQLHYPVYSAGFALCPYFTHATKDLFHELATTHVALQLRQDTIDCCVSFLRRFDEEGKLRPSVLPSNHSELCRYREILHSQLRIFQSMVLGPSAMPPHEY